MTATTATTAMTSTTSTTPVLALTGVDKSFTMHLQGGQNLTVLRRLAFEVHAGECVVLGGVSGAGKSSILKMVYGNYAADRGEIRLRTAGIDLDVAVGDPRSILQARRYAMGYVSQFLHCVPRVPALDVVASPLLERGVEVGPARERAARLLTRLAIPTTLWSLPPATFSGGEQQRVNIARGFIADLPLLLLDEPTASLDAANRDVVVALIQEKLAAGTGVLGIFHDADVRDRVADRVVHVEEFTEHNLVAHASEGRA
ncbi:MAG: phosphonate C-P lyase system protein PhnL [Dermatophilus congolensis]|nr:phosphonate C-P lyase system protein PhnL [Dermatophilus congolensis]